MADNQPFMLVSGISGQAEMCLAAARGTVALQPCGAAVAAGDGRELWQLGWQRDCGLSAQSCTPHAIGFVASGHRGGGLVLALLLRWSALGGAGSTCKMARLPASWETSV